MVEWFERDDVWEALAPVLFDSIRLRNAEPEIDRVLKLSGLEPPAEVLDLCCGPGRHSLDLVRRGFRVTGVDLTQRYLDEAASGAALEGLDLELVRADMREFRRPEAFDGAFNLFSSFGYFDDPAEDRQVVMNLATSLRPGGVLVMDLMPKEVIARDYRSKVWDESDGVILVQEHRVERDWSWLNNRWIIIRPDGQRSEVTFGLRLYSAVELRALLRECGFEQIEFRGGWDLGAYDHLAKRLIAVARRP